MKSILLIILLSGTCFILISLGYLALISSEMPNLVDDVMAIILLYSIATSFFFWWYKKLEWKNDFVYLFLKTKSKSLKQRKRQMQEELEQED